MGEIVTAPWPAPSPLQLIREARIRKRGQEPRVSRETKRLREGMEALYPRLRGISWDAATQRWKARIMVDGRSVHLGSFVRPETAAEAYRAAKESYRNNSLYSNAT